MLSRFRARRLFARALKLKLRGDHQGARETLDRIIDSGLPGYGPNAGYLLGRKLLASGDLAGAQSAFERAVAYRHIPLQPQPPDPEIPTPREAVNWAFNAAVGLEVVHERQNDDDGARHAKALSHEVAGIEQDAYLAGMNHPAQIDLKRAQEFSSYDHPPGARRAYEQAIAAGHPKWSGRAANALGVLLGKQGDTDGARAAFEQAITLGEPHIAAMARDHLEHLPAGETGQPE